MKFRKNEKCEKLETSQKESSGLHVGLSVELPLNWVFVTWKFCSFSMGDAQEPQGPLLNELGQEAEGAKSSDHAAATHQSPFPPLKSRKWWLRIVIYTLCVLVGQSGATLLAGLYYRKGGKNIWLAALMETIAFPILIPFSLYFSQHNHDDHQNNNSPTKTPPLILATVYICLGLMQALDNMLYSIGLLNLPVSTFSLICATQLAFNAFFSFFLNAQKLTPLILNSLVLLTISPALLVYQSDSETKAGASRRQYSIGFSCTVVASALYSLMLSLTQLFFCKVQKRETSTMVLNMIVYQSLVATCVSTLVLLASGKWNGLAREMENFELGKVSYLTVLVSLAVAWQVFSIGAVALIFEVSSLFSNVISTLALPIVPVLAVIFFHDTMNGVKVIALLLAIWGFASYLYQHYLDTYKSEIDHENATRAPEEAHSETC
ncbi:probable purine permease 10 [Cornus florida]|uniref:probable purine permease 10 n=1 Tax=Cornus florida TaxID=4283 RepID=UPI00289A8E66|nr:probable purine permease 10 [Cornus florida]